MLAMVPTRVDFVWFGIVDRSVMLSGEENFLVAGQRLFECAHGTFAADDERTHLLRKDDHLAHRHHRHAFWVAFFPVKHGILIWGFQYSSLYIYPAFSSRLQLISRLRTISAVTTNSRTLRCAGR